MNNEIINGVRTKKVEIVEVIDDKRKYYKNVEFFKSKGRKFVKIFQKGLLKHILYLSAGGKAVLLDILTVIKKGNEFYTIDLRRVKNLFKYLKELEENNIIVKIDRGKYMISPFICAIGYDTEIDKLLEKWYNLTSKNDAKLLETLG